jgi:hypothetical protein
MSGRKEQSLQRMSDFWTAWNALKMEGLDFGQV